MLMKFESRLQVFSVASKYCNSEIFAVVLFSRKLRIAYKIKSSRNFEIILSFTDLGKPCQSRDFYVANMSFNAIRENKILEFTVNDCLQVAVNSVFRVLLV